MNRAIFYKEWLKIRWAYLVLFLILIILHIVLWVNINYSLKLSGASSFWLAVIQKKYVFYKILMYFPVLAGFVLALAQYIPEIHHHRLRLTLRLPMNEAAIVLRMNLFGAVALFSLYLVNLALVMLIIPLYFPQEVLVNVMMTSIPWMLGGWVAYFMTGVILIEPVWIRRLLLVPIALGFGNMYYLCLSVFDANAYSYTRVLPVFLLLTLISGCFVFYTAHRYQKGVE
jgi:hypothetical protein